MNSAENNAYVEQISREVQCRERWYRSHGAHFGYPDGPPPHDKAVFGNSGSSNKFGEHYALEEPYVSRSWQTKEVPVRVRRRVKVKKLIKVPVFSWHNETYPAIQEKNATRNVDIFVKRSNPKNSVQSSSRILQRDVIETSARASAESSRPATARLRKTEIETESVLTTRKRPASAAPKRKKPTLSQMLQQATIERNKDNKKTQPSNCKWGLRVKNNSFHMGVIVTHVQDDSIARCTGLRSGDVITHVDGKAIRNVGDFRSHAKLTELTTRVHITVKRLSLGIIHMTAALNN